MRAGNETDQVLQGGGECGALLRSLDWQSNPLGPPASWPQELRVVVALALGSRQPMLIVWGPQQITLYNDGYAAMCGARHPAALGRPFKELWFDIWDQIDPIISAAYRGISTSMDDIGFIMHRNGFPEETHFAFSYTPVRDTSGNVLGMFCACVETTGQVIMQRRIAQEREHMRQIFESALGAVAILNGPDHVFTFANQEYLTLIGHRDVAGKTVADALPEVVGQGFLDLLDRVMATGEAYIGRNVEIELQRIPGGTRETRILDFGYHPIMGAGGRAEGIFVQAMDITDRADAEREQDLLNHEISHRLKNQLGLIQAIANQTLRSAKDLDGARTSLVNRIGVLSRAQEMLLTGTAGSTTIAAIVHEMASLHQEPGEGRFHTSGPEQVVGPRAALSLSLILHELSTNAAKHGALSEPGGSVQISWRTEQTPEGACFVLEWEESGGPAVTAPAQTGSGTRLLKAGVSGARFSEVTLDFPATGAWCRICVDRDGLQSF